MRTTSTSVSLGYYQEIIDLVGRLLETIAEWFRNNVQPIANSIMTWLAEKRCKDCKAQQANVDDWQVAHDVVWTIKNGGGS